ncbi:MAG: hypothetical protein LKM36_02675 [Flavobacteriales bacterium]|jgi:hypothetical protein|nr:hypothetical protein [Flavobacteriales bacterium]MCI1751791.1 hypothetical protein [Flavobacteriales bacterium]
MRKAAVYRTDRQLPEWLLFLLVSLTSFREAWIKGGTNTYDFFWKAWDGLGYYQWLPSAFITGKFEWMFWSKKISDHTAISLYSLGVSVLELPFFLVSQWFTWFYGYPNTGFSPPNAVAMMASSAIYAGLGAVISFKLARRYSTTPAALLAVLAIFAGSNLFYYATDQPLMSHVYSYFLVALFCWCTLRIIDGPRKVHVVLFLFSGALLVLIRQLNVVVFIFPLWMAWTSHGGIKGAWRNLLQHRTALLLGLFLGLLPWVLQSIYWHYLTGNWYANGYAYSDEHFDFSKMVPGLVLFSPRNGWFTFSPIFLIVVGTLLFHVWRNTGTARPLLVIFLATVLIYSAWWCWWLGGAFGYRGLVDLYALFAIPLSWFFRSVMRRSWSMRIFTALVIIALVRLNFGMMEHYDYAWFTEDSTWPRILEVVGKIAAGQ